MKELRFHDHWRDAVIRGYKTATRRLCHSPDELPPYKFGELVRVVDGQGPYGYATIGCVALQPFSDITPNEIKEEGWSPSFGDPIKWFKMIISDIYGPDVIDDDEAFWAIDFAYSKTKPKRNTMRVSKYQTIMFEGKRTYLSAAAIELGLNWGTVYSRLRRGQNIQEALYPTDPSRLDRYEAAQIMSKEMSDGKKLVKAPDVAYPKDLWAFWRYDQFPNLLCGEIEKINDKGLVYIRSYQSWFRPILILPTRPAVEIREALKLMESRLRSEKGNLYNKFLVERHDLLKDYLGEGFNV